MMTRPMTEKELLDKTWKECLAMWKWICEVDDGSITVCDLKGKYAIKHKKARCAFCKYALTSRNGCGSCPGVLVDPGFDCQDPVYSFHEKPHEFYKKIVSLNKKRKRLEKKEIKNAST